MVYPPLWTHRTVAALPPLRRVLDPGASVSRQRPADGLHRLHASPRRVGPATWKGPSAKGVIRQDAEKLRWAANGLGARTHDFSAYRTLT